MAHSLQRLIVGDEPAAWIAAGFSVENATVVLGKTVIELTGGTGPRGILGWALDGVSVDIDGLPTMIVPDHQLPSPRTHPNQVFAIDHVVVASKNPAQTAKSFELVGIGQRKLVTVPRPNGSDRTQRFFWAGRVIVELIGPAVPDDDKTGASFWGLAMVSANLQIASEALGGALSEPKDAVQPGRKIATLRTKNLGISVPIAFMSPHVANLGEPSESRDVN